MKVKLGLQGNRGTGEERHSLFNDIIEKALSVSHCVTVLLGGGAR